MIKTTPHLGTYEYATQEDRSASRTRVAIPGHIRPAGGKRLATTTRNISLSGFAAIAIARLNPGTKCWLTLPGVPSIEAEVVWWEGGVVGCAFKELLNQADFDALIERWL
ncbi:PilZ domain-containing protein [Novosphingobium sp. 9U]|uniref:PilZ domain-containing protein n=1 Tax=Novosphingobium sp. 9U TaxID=2653158 RepID=UPI0012F3E6D1|nr:PilZ domain-containing protein [Novosphingobium sp. 9U]VWX49277.1 Pilus assembly protein PilZ [Novosphingobium sp. 9U]